MKRKLSSARAPSLVRRKVPRQRRGEITVQSILEATLKVAEVEGFRNLNSRQIAQRAGVSVGSLYQYFPTIESILLAIYEETAGKVNKKFRTSMLDVMHAKEDVVGKKILSLLLKEYEANQLVLHRMALDVPQLTLAPGTATLERLLGADLRVFLLQFRQLTDKDIDGIVFFLEIVIVSSIRGYIERKPPISRNQFIDDLVRITAGFVQLRHGNLRDPDAEPGIHVKKSRMKKDSADQALKPPSTPII